MGSANQAKCIAGRCIVYHSLHQFTRQTSKTPHARSRPQRIKNNSRRAHAKCTSVAYAKCTWVPCLSEMATASIKPTRHHLRTMRIDQTLSSYHLIQKVHGLGIIRETPCSIDHHRTHDLTTRGESLKEDQSTHKAALVFDLKVFRCLDFHATF